MKKQSSLVQEIAELACYYFENDPESVLSIVGFTADGDCNIR